MSGTRMGCRRWTAEEDALVREHYPSHGATWEGWRELLPNRSLNAIRVHANGLGTLASKDVIAANNARAVESSTRHSWTEAEIAELATWYPLHGMSWRGWRDVLPGRGAAAIAKKAKALGLRHRGAGRPVTNDDRSRILATVLALADELRLPPRFVADEVVRLGREHERRAS